MLKNLKPFLGASEFKRKKNSFTSPGGRGGGGKGEEGGGLIGAGKYAARASSRKGLARPKRMQFLSLFCLFE